MNYSFFYKTKLDNVDKDLIFLNFKYDLFISAYNECERVNFVYDNVDAKNKHWIIFPEYDFKPLELLTLEGEISDYSKSDDDESTIILDYYSRIIEHLDRTSKICFDITGFVRPYLIFLVRLLQKEGFFKIDFTYSEPKNYKKKENTLFSQEYIGIREVRGCMNSHNPDTSNDILILGSGYDYKMLAEIAKAKPEAKKIQVLGFPSLQADMFQENIVKVHEAQEDVSSGEFSIDSNEIILAPANDPFVTAKMISDYLIREDKRKKITNIYLSPLSTKAQTLGIALFYTMECLEKHASVIFPFCKRYSRETTEGISRVWIYTVEF